MFLLNAGGLFRLFATRVGIIVNVKIIMIDIQSVNFFTNCFTRCARRAVTLLYNIYTAVLTHVYTKAFQFEPKNIHFVSFTIINKSIKIISIKLQIFAIAVTLLSLLLLFLLLASLALCGLSIFFNHYSILINKPA